MQPKNHTGAQSVTPNSIHPFLFVSTSEDCQNRATAHTGGDSPPSPSPVTGQPRNRIDTRHERITQALNLIGYQTAAHTVGKRVLQRVITQREAAQHAA